jgi:integrase
MPRPRRDGTPHAPIRKEKFTDRLVRSLKAETKPYLIWDSGCRGLAVAVQPTGGCAFKFVYGFARRLRWYHIGDAHAHPLADARKKARALRVQIDNGIDPQGIRIAERDKGTFLEIANRYRDEWAKKKNKSWLQADRLIRKYLIPRWGSLSAGVITRSEVRAAIAKIDAPILANQVLASASAIFSWAVKQEIVALNPCSGVDRNDTKARERVLSDSEIPLFWTAFANAGGIGAALKLLLLLGQRPGEVCHMRREHIKDGWWELPGKPVPELGWPGTKNGQNHRVWIPRAAQVLIGEKRTGFVFEGVKGRLSVTMRDICAALAIEDKVTPHDLRRTHGTTVTALGFGRDAMNRVQNHKEGGIGSVYDRHSYSDENKRIMEVVATHIIGLTEGVDTTSKVVALR